MIDEETKRSKAIKDYLEESGFEVLFFYSVDRSYEFIKCNIGNIDLIILDIMMPDGDLFADELTENGLLTGYLYYNKLRQEFGYSIPVIVYTAINRDEIINNLKSQENTSVFRKPTRPSTIVSEIIKLIK